MKKTYQKPDAEFVRFLAKEAVTADIIEGSEGLVEGEEGWV